MNSRRRVILSVLALVLSLAAPASAQDGGDASHAGAIAALTEVVIEVPFPGAGPAQVEQHLAVPIEATVASVPGLLRMESRCREGLLVTTLRAGPEVSPRAFQQAVLERLQAFPSLPPGAEAPTVRITSAAGVDARSYVLFGDVEASVLETVTERLRHALYAVPGVTSVAPRGAPARQILVRYEPEHVLAYGLTPDAIVDVLRDASGWGRTPIEVEAIGHLPIPGTEALVRVADVVGITDHYEWLGGQHRFDGHPAVYLDVEGGAAALDSVDWMGAAVPEGGPLSLRPVASIDEDARPFRVFLSAAEVAPLAEASEAVRAVLAGLGAEAIVTSPPTEGAPETLIAFDRAALAALGTSTTEAHAALALATRGVTVHQADAPDIVVQPAGGPQGESAYVEGAVLFLTGPAGSPVAVPLSSVATVTVLAGPAERLRRNGLAAMVVTFALPEGADPDAMPRVEAELRAMPLPLGVVLELESGR